MEQNAENNTNQFIMYRNSSYKSTFCAKTAGFVPRWNNFTNHQLTLIIATCPAMAGLSYYPITALTI